MPMESPHKTWKHNMGECLHLCYHYCSKSMA